MKQYNEQELKLLPPKTLIDIILNQEARLDSSHRGQPRRDNLVGQGFSALSVVGDGGNEQGHSIWHCRCSGDIRNSDITGVCDRAIRVWGSNLKANRQTYCGNEDCPASRQVLGQSRRKGLTLDQNFRTWLKDELVFKYVLMGDQATKLVLKDYNYLTAVLEKFYGLGDSGEAFKIDEIAQNLGMRSKEVSNIKKDLDSYVVRYQELVRDEVVEVV